MEDSLLEDIGLSKAEIRVYLTLLESGPSTSGPIIDSAGLQSSVVHRAVKSLIKKGLVSFVVIGKDKQYQATDPKNLVHYLEEKKNKLQDILPELNARAARAKEKNNAEMFIGARALMSMLEGLIKDARPGEDYLSFSLGEHHKDPAIARFYTHYQLRRKEKKLNLKVLANWSAKSPLEKIYPKRPLKEINIRYSKIQLPQGLIIFRDQVVFLSWGDNPFAVKVTSKEMARQYHQFFMSVYEKTAD